MLNLILKGSIELYKEHQIAYNTRDWLQTGVKA